jgi:3-dehydroquinate synthase
MHDIIIKSKLKDFPVHFVSDFSFIKEFLDIPHCVIVGKNVYRLYQDTVFNQFVKENIMILDFDEERKTMETVLKIHENLLNKSAKKNLTIISFGGGINQDVTGFAASTLYRGVNWIYVPTTLLAMADSSIGLKTSLNFKKYKNVLGTFYPPTEIYININFLDTLEQVDYQSGVGEIMKLLLMDESSIKKLDIITKQIDALREKKNKKIISDTIMKALKVKMSYMEGDEFDLGRRNLLNYGHEFGHALEPASSYYIPHGIAVMIGIIFANYVSSQRGLLSKELYEQINTALLLPNIQHAGLHFEKIFFDVDTLLENMKKDKKRITEGLVLVLPKKNLELVKINDLTVDELRCGVIELRNLLSIS